MGWSSERSNMISGHISPSPFLFRRKSFSFSFSPSHWKEAKSLPFSFVKDQQIGIPFQGPSGRWFVRRQSDGRVVPSKNPNAEKTPKTTKKPKEKEPPKKPKKQEVSVDSVRSYIEKSRSEGLTEQSVSEIVGMLGSLKIADIRKLRDEVGGKSGGRSKEEIKERIKEKLEAKQPEKAEPQPEVADKPKRKPRVPKPQVDKPERMPGDSLSGLSDKPKGVAIWLSDVLEKIRNGADVDTTARRADVTNKLNTLTIQQKKAVYEALKLPGDPNDHSTSRFIQATYNARKEFNEKKRARELEELRTNYGTEEKWRQHPSINALGNRLVIHGDVMDDHIQGSLEQLSRFPIAVSIACPVS